MASTLPNREYMHAAQSYGLVDNDLPPQTEMTTGYPWETTIWHALDQAGVSNQYYYVDVPVTALWGVPGVQKAQTVEGYYAACAAGTLPHVSFVDPYFAGSAAKARRLR